MPPKRRRNKNLFNELTWLQRESNNVTHLSFFNFFDSYSRPTTVRRFKKVVEHIPDNEEKAQVLKEFSKWKRSRAAQQYWANRENAQNNDRINDNNGNSSTEATGVTSTSSVRYSSTSTSCSSSSNNSVEIISVDEAKDLIRGSYTNSTNNTNSNYSDLQQSFFNFKIDTFNHVTESKLLSFESNLQQLLALSNILLIGKKHL